MTFKISLCYWSIWTLLY